MTILRRTTPTTSNAASKLSSVARTTHEITLPTPVPIMHSTAFLKQRDQGEDTDEMHPVGHKRRATSSVKAKGGLIETLQSIDRHLEAIEEQPNALHQKLYDISQGPMAQAAGKGLESAAGVTLRAGESLIPVVKKVVASPAVTQATEWAVQAANGIAQALLVEAARRLGDSKWKKESVDERGSKAASQKKKG